uniref:ShKT domain-containing protein n=1 Tax=Ditylenchus dipsaci TaxID=166011 RepID=A0A915CLG0_9BILA
MFQHCRKTCRLCVPPGFDNYFRNEESLETIGQKRDIPLKPNVLARSKRQVETAAKCGDLGPDCLLYTNYCTNQYYLGFMMNHCPVSCGFCKTSFTNNEVGASLSGTSCKDVVAECEELGRIGFCESDEQSTEIKRTLCAATCKLCLRFSVATFNNSTGSFTIGNSSANVVVNKNTTSSEQVVSPQPVVVVGKRVQPATDDNTLCIDRDAGICGKIQTKCVDKDFFDYLIVFCPATCALCGQRRKRTSLIPSVRERAIQFVRRQRVGDEPKPIRGCIDKYEKCDTLITTNSFCENTSGRFLCKATCGYCRPIPTTTAVVISEETNQKPVSEAKPKEAEEGTTDVSEVVDNDTSDSNSEEEPKFTEVVIPSTKSNGKPTIIRIPRKFSDEEENDEEDEDGLDAKPTKRRSKNIIDVDESLGDATIEELLAVEKAKEAKRELEEEAAGLPLSVRRLLARSRNQHRIPLLNKVLTLRRRRLINHLLNGRDGVVNNDSLSTENPSSSPDSNEESASIEEKTEESPLADSLEELLASSEQLSIENANHSATFSSRSRRIQDYSKTSSKDPKQKRRTIILINNGIQTVENAREKPKKNEKRAEKTLDQVSATNSPTTNKTLQKKANRQARVILKTKGGRDNVIENPKKGQSSQRKSNQKQPANKRASKRKGETEQRQNSQVAPKLISQELLEKAEEIISRIQTEPRLQESTNRQQNAHNWGAPEEETKPQAKSSDAHGGSELATKEPKLASDHALNSEVAKPEEQHITQSSQPVPHQLNLLTSTEQADQIIPSLNVPQNQANLFAAPEHGQNTANRRKRAASSLDKNTQINTSENKNEAVEPKENWLKKQFEDTTPEEKADSVFENHLEPADTNDILLSTAISSIQVVQTYPKEEFKSRNKEKKKEKRSKRSLENKSKNLVKFEVLNSSTTAENDLDSGTQKNDGEIVEKQKLTSQQKIVEPKENWLTKQFEDVSKNGHTSSASWEETLLGSSDGESDSFESSLFPVLQKAPWRLPAYHLKEIRGNRNQTEQ